jgi:hypothetical protein
VRRRGDSKLWFEVDGGDKEAKNLGFGEEEEKKRSKIRV